MLYFISLAFFFQAKALRRVEVDNPISSESYVRNSAFSSAQWKQPKEEKPSLAIGNPKLIFDIGMNRGDDTNNYLRLGFNVVSVEANPAWANKMSEVFRSHVENGKLVIKNMAISDKLDQSLSFYIPKLKQGASEMLNWLDAQGLLKQSNFTTSTSSVINETDSVLAISVLNHMDELSSISKGQACGWFGCDHGDSFCECQEVPVTSTTCAELIRQHGTPHYLKVDIEGYDGHCMRSIAALPCSKLPSYISFEEQSGHSHAVASSEELIRALSVRGYAWKVSRQNFTNHAKLGTGPFGEDAQDYMFEKKWSLGTEAVQRANIGCWSYSSEQAGPPLFDCDIHGRLDISSCSDEMR